MKNTYETPLSADLIETVRTTVLATRIDEARKINSGDIADLTNRTVKRTKNGNFRVAKEFFYRHGRTSETHADAVSKALSDAGVKHDVVDHGEHNTAFRGGESTWRNSHHWVDIKVHPDAKITEQAEPLDELSKSTLGNYAKVAMADREDKMMRAKKHADVGHEYKNRGDRESADLMYDRAADFNRRASNRKKGAVTAINKLTKEETEINELSKATLGRYIKAASGDLIPKQRVQDRQFNTARDYPRDSKSAKFHAGEGMKTGKKIQNRRDGIDKATDKLTAEPKKKEKPQMHGVFIKWHSGPHKGQEVAHGGWTRHKAKADALADKLNKSLDDDGDFQYRYHSKPTTR